MIEVNYKEILKGPEYDGLRQNPLLKNPILVALSGSHAYGLATANSDLDVRGIALNPKEEILLAQDFAQVEHRETDTVIYSFNKAIQLLSESNPNTLAMLGCRPEHYLYLSEEGSELLARKKMFLSRQCKEKFGEYASDQLRKLENKAIHDKHRAEQEKHVLRRLEGLKSYFQGKYTSFPDDAINLAIKASNDPAYDKEIFMTLQLTDYPLRDWCKLWNEMKQIANTYDKLGKRNKNAIEHDKLGKHQASLLMLYMQCIDILEKEEIIIFREEEHDLLQRVRRNEFLDGDKPTPEFYEIVHDYEKRLAYAEQNTSLPDLPNYKEINEFRLEVNERVVRG